jgi:hypothetical protein
LARKSRRKAGWSRARHEFRASAGVLSVHINGWAPG